METALLAQMNDASLLLLVKLTDAAGCITITGDLGNGYYLGVNGNVAIVGREAHVISGAGTSTIDDYKGILSNGAPFTFVYGMQVVTPGYITSNLSLRAAELVSGVLNFSDGNVSGEVKFHLVF